MSQPKTKYTSMKNILTVKKIVSLFFACVFLVLGGACVTTAMWKDKGYNYKNYTETVSSFLASADKKQLVVLGKERHYVFNFEPHLKNILGSALKNKVTARFYTFTLNTSTGKVFGTYQLRLADDELLPEDKQLAKKLGFMESKNQYKQTYWRIHQHLKGNYYQAGNFTLPANSIYLNKIYRVKVKQKTPKKHDNVRKVLLTPLTVAADGILMIGSIPFVILGAAK